MGAVILVTQGAERFEAISDLLAGGMQLLVDRLLLVGSPAVFSPGPLPRLSAQATLRVRLASRTPQSSSPLRWPTAGPGPVPRPAALCWHFVR